MNPLQLLPLLVLTAACGAPSRPHPPHEAPPPPSEPTTHVTQSSHDHDHDHDHDHARGAESKRAPDLPSIDAGSALPAWRPDAEIVSDIEQTIRRNSLLMAQGTTVHVTSAHGEVRLRGTVKDESSRAAVNAIVRSTPGVLRIQDLMKAIDPTPPDVTPGPTGY